MKWWLPFLGFIFLGELFEEYQWGVLRLPTIDINYLIGIVESIFYSYYFYKLTHSSTLKKLILFCVGLSILGYLVSFIFFRKEYAYFFGNIIISGFFLALIALTYLYMKFVDDEENLLISEPGFWIALGVCLFYSGVSISFSLHGIIKNNNLTLFGESLLNIIPRILSVILYLSISISIILCKPKKKIFS